MGEQCEAKAAMPLKWWQAEARDPMRCTRLTVKGSPWWWRAMLNRRRLDWWGIKERCSDRRLWRRLRRDGLIDADGNPTYEYEPPSSIPPRPPRGDLS